MADRPVTLGGRLHFSQRDSLDAALLLLRGLDSLDYDRPRMVATADEVAEQRRNHGLARRYRGENGRSGDGRVFVACTFWLSEC